MATRPQGNPLRLIFSLDRLQLSNAQLMPRLVAKCFKLLPTDALRPATISNILNEELARISSLRIQTTRYPTILASAALRHLLASWLQAD